MSFKHLVIWLGLSVLPFRLAAGELPAWISIGPDGGNVQALAVSPALPNWIVAGVPQGFGIFKSADRGVSWGAATDALGRNVHSLAIDAEGRSFYAAANRGLLKSVNRGGRWMVLDASADVYTVVATHPRQPATVFAVRAGVLLRSLNGGVTRTAIEGPQGVLKIAFAPAGSRALILAGGANGLWKSLDDGQTWTEESPPLSPSPSVQALAVDPGDSRVLYIGLQQGESVLFKSLDGGGTWQPSQSGLPVAGNGTLPAVSELVVDPGNRSTVYAVVGGELFRSVNGGRDWARPIPRLPGGGFINALETTPYGLLAGTPSGVLLSTDRGLTWQFRVSGLAAASIDGMAVDQQDPARLYAADVPAGIFKTASQGRPWLRLGDLAGPSDVNQPLAVDPDNPNLVYAGASNGIFKSTNGGRRWAMSQFFSCQTTFQIVIDPREPAHLFASVGLRPPCLDPYLCTLYRSLDAGGSWQCIGQAINFPGNPLVGIAPPDSSIYALGVFRSLIRSTDDGGTWELARPGVWSADSFAASPLVVGTLWAGQGEAVMRSRDGGQTWESFSAGLPGEPVIGLAPDPVEPATLYAATRSRGIFKSTNAGETWSLAGTWPPGALYRGGLLVDPSEPAIVYAGTDGLSVLRLDQSGN